MFQNSTKHYPATLPPYSTLPTELRPKMAAICTLRSKASLLYKTISSYESHMAHLRRKKDLLEREAIELEISLWEALGKVKKLAGGPGTVVAFRSPKPLTQSEPLDSSEAMLKAMANLSSEAREELVASLIQSQRADLAKESASQGDGDWDDAQTTYPECPILFE